MSTEIRTLLDFEGTWSLVRRVVQRDGPRARFEGHAEWQPDGAGMIYTETGLLELEGHAPLQARRRYIWQDDLSVCFEDGRLFHHVPPSGGPAQHWCDPDMYRVLYRFARWPYWETVWRVTGPRKNYAMVTRYFR